MARRHGAELEDAIRAAVLDLVRERGVSAVTMEAVATRARTSKPVLYRRWPDRAALLRDALLAAATAAIPHADTGSYRGDVLAVLRGWAAAMTGELAPVLVAVIAATAEDPELAVAFREGVIGWRKQEMGELIGRAVERGEARPDVPVHLVRELGQSVLWHRLLVSGDPIDDALVTAIVDEVLLPVVSPRSADRRPAT
jgi:AcrR family transcriptional regulator